jgi:hypothetical protein
MKEILEHATRYPWATHRLKTVPKIDARLAEVRDRLRAMRPKERDPANNPSAAYSRLCHEREILLGKRFYLNLSGGGPSNGQKKSVFSNGLGGVLMHVGSMLEEMEQQRLYSKDKEIPKETRAKYMAFHMHTFSLMSAVPTAPIYSSNTNTTSTTSTSTTSTTSTTASSSSTAPGAQ